MFQRVLIRFLESVNGVRVGCKGYQEVAEALQSILGALQGASESLKGLQGSLGALESLWGFLEGFRDCKVLELVKTHE